MKERMNHRGTETQRDSLPPVYNRISGAIVHAAYTVHTTLGPGLLESIYEACLAYELQSHGYNVKRQVTLPIQYGDLLFNEGYRIDLTVEDLVLVELKAVETVLPIHRAQILTYMKLAEYQLGLLINFNTPRIKDSIFRFVL